MLVAMLPAAVFVNHWLTVKLVMLVIYMVLGSFALKRGHNDRVGGVSFGAATGCMRSRSIARAHQPLGLLAI
ncbi:hypothetical protein ASE08_09655 [Rhizobacter sp. Root16D2]|nr:hypothetical protein ASE08_09655 [Rhizobacter sp. Root16D2]